MPSKKIQITLKQAVLKQLEALSKEKGISKSAVISLLINDQKRKENATK